MEFLPSSSTTTTSLLSSGTTLSKAEIEESIWKLKNAILNHNFHEFQELFDSISNMKNIMNYSVSI